MNRYLCIHGHFYQPPRENPWLEAVEIQDSAAPYHDWNERVTAECYAPNAVARILDDKGLIRSIVNNYSRISFNMGPTLLAWLQRNNPEAYEAVLEADRLSQKTRGGHGSAMAQCYNHMIMPLASRREKLTQVRWGVEDFRYRFKRNPDGMWLPETAVDIETLGFMADEGIKFTVLAPHQAKGVKPLSEKTFKTLDNGSIDPRRPYRLMLPNGNSIAVFFYNGPVSVAVAFEGLLKSGEEFSRKLLSGFDPDDRKPQLMHIATDGESYGHHHKFGEMALAFALHKIEREGLARLTNYSEYLSLHPPEHEVQILENSSWSCAHGVERWRSDCGCSTGSNPGWNQRWREPLRKALDWLRDEAAVRYEITARQLLRDPWLARDDYISVVLDRTPGSIEAFLSRHASRPLGPDEESRALSLLEAQRHSMLMFTSCGWFFDDISGIEARQVLEYACRLIQLIFVVQRESLEDEFLRRLAPALSNVKGMGSASEMYLKRVKPGTVSLEKVAAHFAISSMFHEYEDDAGIFRYRVRRMDYRKLNSESASLVAGRCEITSEITHNRRLLSFAALHLGDHDFNCGVCKAMPEDEYRAFADKLSDTFESGSYAEIVRMIDARFGTFRYHLTDLFRDEQRSILESIMLDTMIGIEDSLRALYSSNRILMGFIREAGMPLPRAFKSAAEFVLSTDLMRALEGDAPAPDIEAAIEELQKWGITPDEAGTEYAFRKSLERAMRMALGETDNHEPLARAEELVRVSGSLHFPVNLWMAQNLYYRLWAAKSRGRNPVWDKAFDSLGNSMFFKLDDPPEPVPVRPAIRRA